ncbi:MAG TPA: hypothetical protein ENI26_08620 [Methylophaga aminisulfidivorans]|uniref:DUF3037 domain-containing protein n=2 Tax=root TaxID=1 RepID=A0A7C1VSI5_9GAMM|nr:hypothetical protein [Methylophaga aminisulfidivorans]
MQETRRTINPTNDLIAGQWCPIYLEPIRHSGELITIAVALLFNDPKQNRLISTLPKDITKCIYKERSHQLFNLAELVLEELNPVIKKSSDITTYQFSLDGISFGKVKHIREKNIDSMIRIAVNSSSSLSNITGMQEATDEPEEKWQDTIKQIVTNTRPSLAQSFNRPLILNKRKIATIGFVNNKLVTNFHDIRNKNFSQLLTFYTKSLLNLKNFADSTPLDINGEFWKGLILHRPKLSMRELKRYNNSIETLEYYANSLDINIRQVQESEEAAEIILASANNSN